MPHKNSVLVIHSNGAISYTQRPRAEGAHESGIAYWRDPAKTVLVMIKSTDDKENEGYEYGGAKSYDEEVERLEKHDRTGIPVRQAGGHQVMQLIPMHDRRTEGRHLTRKDRLWHPKNFKPTPRP